MKGLPTILSSLALLGVIILFALHFGGGKKNGAAITTSSSTTTASGAPGASRMAWVDIDTFEAHYESLRKKKEEFDAERASMKSELQRSAEQMRADYASVMKKQQAGTLTQAEGEAAQKRLGQMQQSLETREQSMSKRFSDSLEAFNQELHQRMDEYLTEYAKAHHYDYVLAYSLATPVILYGDKGLDITQEVIRDMNARANKPAPAKGK